MYNVKVVLSVPGAYVTRRLRMPILPVGTLVFCVEELPEPLEISHWCLREDGGASEIECHLNGPDMAFNETFGTSETVQHWLERVGFTVEVSRCHRQ